MRGIMANGKHGNWKNGFGHKWADPSPWPAESPVVPLEKSAKISEIAEESFKSSAFKVIGGI
jgi:hypothetical protein